MFCNNQTSLLFSSRNTSSCIGAVCFYKSWINIINAQNDKGIIHFLNSCICQPLTLAARRMKNCDTGGHKCSQKLSFKRKKDRKKKQSSIIVRIRLSGPSKFYTFPSRARLLIRPALQTAAFLPLVLSRRRIRCTGTSDGGAGTEPVMAKWCQKWPHLCQFEIKDQFALWTAAVNVLSLISAICISTVAPWCIPFSCEWNVRLLIWGFMRRLTVSAYSARLRRGGGIPSRCLLLSYLILKSVPGFSVLSIAMLFC